MRLDSATTAAITKIEDQLKRWGFTRDQAIWGHLRGNALQHLIPNASATRSDELEQWGGRARDIDIGFITQENGAGRLATDFVLPHSSEGYQEAYRKASLLIDFLSAIGAQAALATKEIRL